MALNSHRLANVVGHGECDQAKLLWDALPDEQRQSYVRQAESTAGPARLGRAMVQRGDAPALVVPLMVVEDGGVGQVAVHESDPNDVVVGGGEIVAASGYVVPLVQRPANVSS